MTSVLNRQQLSSGNKLLLVVFLFLSVFMISSCGGSKDTTSRKRTTSTTTKRTKFKKNQPTDRKTSMPPRGSKNTDVVLSEEKEEEEDQSTIEANTDLSSPKKDIYNVSILIPLEAQKYSVSAVSSSSVALKFTNFYNGVMIALQELDEAGVQLNVNIFDSKSRTIQQILKDENFKRSDVVIGPYSNKDISIVASWAKKNEIVLVSPWKSSKKITKNNPYYLQLLPTLEDHYEKMVYTAMNSYDPENVYLLARDTKKDQSRLRKLQIIAAKKLGIRKKPFQEFTLEMDSLISGVAAYDSIFFNQERSAYLLPNWSSDDEDFVYSALRKMNSEKGLMDVKVYGMPILLESDKIEFDFYKNLQLQVVKSNFVDRQEHDINNFKRTYFNFNDALPTQDAYHGFDTMKFVGESLYKYGARFHLNPSMRGGTYLQATYEIVPVYSDDKKETKQIDYYANKSIDVIEFRNNKFVRE